MRILITTYHEAFLHKGGGEFEIITLANVLQRFGIVADIYGPYCQNLEKYDLVIHFSVHPGGLELLKSIKKINIPIILIPNFYTNGNFNDFELLNSFLDLSNIVLFNSNAMKNHFLNLIKFDNSKIKVVNYLIDNRILKKIDGDIFKKLYNIDKYALTFGIVEENKNQLQTIEVLTQMGIKLVVVGKYRDRKYYDLCKQSGRNVLFIESLAYHSDIMLSALNGCEFYIELSKEPAGLSALEAAISGSKIIVNDTEWGREILSDNVEFIDINKNNNDIVLAINDFLKRSNEEKIVNERLLKHLSDNSIYDLIEIFKYCKNMKNKE